MRVAVALVIAAMTVAPRLAMADDADLIPSGVLAEPPPPPPKAGPEPAKPKPPSTLQHKLFLEDAFTVSSFDHDVAVPYPPTLAVGWQNRTSFDVYLQWKPLKSLSLTLSDRLNLYVQDQQPLISRDAIRNDFREAYVTWEPHTGLYLEAGRINVRNGAALGFNPSDFFKTRTLVGQASLDPSVIRQNRLGTLMVRGQAIWSSGSASVAFAPKVMSPAPVVDSDPLGVDPHFGATNGAYRVLGTLSFDVLNLSPQLLVYYEPGRGKVGLNLSRPIGDAVVVYGEWAGGPEEDLVARAIAFGQETRTLPRTAPVVPPTDTSTNFLNDVAAGFSWTIATKATLNVEYHFHQAGLGLGDWRQWFALGSVPHAASALTGELWYLRAYAGDQQEPLTQHQAFVRASWPRAFVNDLELTAFAFVDLLDGSVLSQVSANYYLSPRWTASVYLSSSLGTARSERGSFPQRVSSIFQLTLYL
jgi:hypothetical protein